MYTRVTNATNTQGKHNDSHIIGSIPIPARNAEREDIKRQIARSHRASAMMKASQQFNVGTNSATRLLQAQINAEQAKRQALYAQLLTCS